MIPLISEKEIFELFKMKEAMCKIYNKSIEGRQVIGTGFFCNFCNIKTDNFPMKFCLFTHNCILEETDIKSNENIQIMYCNRYKEITINENRKKYINKELSYTCIEIFEYDGIKNFFKIDPHLFINENNDYLLHQDIFILQYPRGNDLSFSYGKILEIEDNCFIHNASTDHGSSGSPVIIRGDHDYIIGIQSGVLYDGIKDKINCNRIATIFNSIFQDILEQYKIQINYISKNEKEINLLHELDILKSQKFPPPLYIGLIFDVSKEDLNQLIRFDNKNNFLEDFISEIDGEIVTLINGNEKIPYYDLNEILISSINYLCENNTINLKNKEAEDFYFNKGKQKNLLDEITIKNIFSSVKKNCNLINSKKIYENMKKLKEIFKRLYSKFFSIDFFLNHYISKPSSISLALEQIIEVIIKSTSEALYRSDSKEYDFKKSEPIKDQGNKFIIIISDGNTKEIPKNALLNEAKNNNITIVTVLLKNKTRKIFYDELPNDFNKGEKYLFQISSKVSYKNPFAHYYIQKDWDFPIDGKATLFYETNQNDFCNSHFGQELNQIRFEAIDIRIGDLNYDQLMKYEFKFLTKNQIFGTCWANACSAALFLANKRILGKKIEAFENFREALIKEASYKNIDGGNIKNEEVNQLFLSQRLHYKEVDENVAKKAIQRGRFIVCNFYLKGKQWDNFGNFYNNNRYGILKKNDINKGMNTPSQSGDGGHSVLLIEIGKEGERKYLRFLNSWGIDWADGGTFKVESIDVLTEYKKDNTGNNPVLYDIFFYENELTSEEKAYYYNNIDFVRELLSDKNFELIKARMNHLYMSLYECNNCKKSMELNRINELKIYREKGLYKIVCSYCNSNIEAEKDLRELLILRDFMDDGNKDFDINFEENCYIQIDRVELNKDFANNIENKSDICSIGIENRIHNKIDSYLKNKVNCIIYLENENEFLKFAACDSTTILVFELRDATIISPIIERNIDEDLRTLCDLKSKNSNLIASGGKNLIISKINYTRQKLEIIKKIRYTSGINKIIVLYNQEIIRRIAVCEQNGYIGLYNIKEDEDYISFSFKVQCHSKNVNCIIYLPEENILVSGSSSSSEKNTKKGEEQNLKFWKIKVDKNELALIASFGINSPISNNSLLDINGNLLVGQTNCIRVFHHEQGIIAYNYYFNNEEFEDGLGGIFSIKPLRKNYFICGRAFGFCSIFLLREKSIRKINIFRNNNASIKPYNLLDDKFYITDICVKEKSEIDGYILISSVDKTLKVYKFNFHQYSI